MSENKSCEVLYCGRDSVTEVLNENGCWRVCYGHINYFDQWNEAMAPPVDWAWINKNRSVFSQLHQAGVKITTSWVRRIGKVGPSDRYTELYIWLLENASYIPPHTNKVLLHEFIKLFFRYAEFNVHTFHEHFDIVVDHPLYDPLEFMKVYLTVVRNHKAARRYMIEMLKGPCKQLLFMGPEYMEELYCNKGVMETYKQVREEEKILLRREMKERLAFKEDLIAAAWHPSRVMRWIDAGYEILDL